MLKLFEALTIFDWITPAIGFIQNVAHVQTAGHTFFVPYDESLSAGWNARDIGLLLDKHNIRHWGGQYVCFQDEYFFSVAKKRAQQAEDLLSSYGVPITTY